MYQYMKAYAIPLLARVQEDGEYSSGDRILFAGLPDEEKIQSMNPLYKYSYRYRAVFWDGEYGVLTCWPRYIQYYLSMDTGFISADEYHEVLDSEKFAEMNCYPEIDSIAKIGDIMVVKLESAPPRNFYVFVRSDMYLSCGSGDHDDGILVSNFSYCILICRMC